MSSYRFGRFEIQPVERRLLIDGKPATLGARAFDLLLGLVDRRERVVTKNELLDLVWSGLVVEENNLQVQISALRKLLGPQAISTIPGRGYRFAAPLDRTGADHNEDLTAATVPTTATPGNLSTHQPQLIGRDADLTALLSLLDRHPLVTVVGAGGMGKTTLALAAAHALRGRFDDGAWLVDMAPVADPALLPQTIAQTLRITVSGAGTDQDRLVNALGGQSLLLLLDNCEHLVAAVSSLVASIMARTSGVRVLITSQELLNLAGEQLYRLGPLAVPAVDESPNIASHGAVRLFVERAQAVDPRFDLTVQNAEAIVEVCRRLDGLPLAIELAAARVRLLGVQGVRDRLDEQFRVLTHGARTSLARHQALHATLDWSHALLSPQEQAVLRRLGVFVGGFSLELAQQVAADNCMDEWAVLDALGGLVDKSLVAVADAEPVRYRLLETTRAYALERLAEHDEVERTRERHAQVTHDFFLRTDEARFGEQGTLSMAEFMQRLVPELDNLRAALDWSLGVSGERTQAIALAGASAEVFRQLGLSQEALPRMMMLWPVVEGESSAESVALFCCRLGVLGNNGRLPNDVVRDAEARAERLYRGLGAQRRLHFCLYGRAWDLNLSGDADAAESLITEMLSLERPTWPVWLRALRLNVQSVISQFQQRFDNALALALEQESLLSSVPGEEAILTTCQSNLCGTLLCLQRFDDAISVARSVIERNTRRRDRNIDYVTFHMMTAQLFLGRLDEAERTARQAIPGWRRDGLLHYAYVGLAMLLAERGRLADAARVDGAATAFDRLSGVKRNPVTQRCRARVQQLIEAVALQPADVARWRREGESLDEGAVVAICIDGPGSATRASST